MGEDRGGGRYQPVVSGCCHVFPQEYQIHLEMNVYFIPFSGLLLSHSYTLPLALHLLPPPLTSINQTFKVLYLASIR